MSLTVSSRMVIKTRVFIITVLVRVKSALGVRKPWPWVTVNVCLRISVEREVSSGPKVSGSVVQLSWHLKLPGDPDVHPVGKILEPYASEQDLCDTSSACLTQFASIPPSPGQGRQTSQSPAGSKANWWIWPASGRRKRSFFYFPCYSLIPFIYLLLIEFQSTRLPPGFPQFSPPPIPTQSGLTWAFPFHIYITVHSIYSATIPLKASFWYPPPHTHTHRLLSGFLA